MMWLKLQILMFAHVCVLHTYFEELGIVRFSLKVDINMNTISVTFSREGFKLYNKYYTNLNLRKMLREDDS